MGEKFYLGVIMGMLGGALIVANSTKAKNAIKDGQTQIKQKVQSLSKKQKQKN